VIDLVLKKQGEGLAPATIENIRAVASSIFSFACEEGLLQVNPAVKLGKYIKKYDKKKSINILTRNQVSHFLEVTRMDYHKHYPFMLCAFRTGMRLGEILALAWEDINFSDNLIKVSRSFSGGNFSTTKNGKIRFVDMSEQLKEVLLDHRKSLLHEFGSQLPASRFSTSERSCEIMHLVFPNRDGKAMDGANFKHRVFYRIIQKAGIPRFRFHDIRHTFASLLLQQGESLHYVKEQMGHATIQTTVDIYGHIVPGANRNAVNGLDDHIQ
jgi:integrase